MALHYSLGACAPVSQSGRIYKSYSTGCQGFMAVNQPSPRAQPESEVGLLP